MTEYKMFASEEDVIKALKMYAESFGGKLDGEISIEPRFNRICKDEENPTFEGIDIIIKK